MINYFRNGLIKFLSPSCLNMKILTLILYTERSQKKTIEAGKTKVIKFGPSFLHLPKEELWAKYNNLLTF